MGAFKEIANRNFNITKEDLDKVFQKIFQKDKVENFIIKNIASDLYSTGITGDGIKLRTDKSKIENAGNVYAWYTINEKKGKGQPYNRITLHDTGLFNYSMYVDANKMYAEILADFNKDGQSIYNNFFTSFNNFNDFRSSVLTLRRDRFNELIDRYIRIAFREELLLIHTKPF